MNKNSQQINSLHDSYEINDIQDTVSNNNNDKVDSYSANQNNERMKYKTRPNKHPKSDPKTR